MLYATNPFRIARGLMFASKKTIDKGICLVLPGKEAKLGSSVTMLFCFSSMDILFLNSKFKVVDKTTLKPFVLSYTPNSPAKYVIESSPNKFKNIKIGDSVKILS